MKAIAISEFKAKCLALLEDVARTGESVVVTKRGKPLARVVPSGGTPEESPQETLRGSIAYLGDIVTPVLPPSAWNATRGVLVSDERPARRNRRRPLPSKKK